MLINIYIKEANYLCFNIYINVCKGIRWIWTMAMFIILLVIYMNLTNPKADAYSLEQSTSFSKYFTNEDRFDDYNYSESNINETLLLEATHLDSGIEKIDQKKLSLLKDFKEDEGLISRQKSLVFQLCGDSYADHSHSSDNKVEKSHDQIEDLYNICRTLVNTLSKLQNKVQKMEEKDVKVKDCQRVESIGSSLEKQAQSILTYSSLRSSNGCKCDSRITQKDVITGLFQALQTKSKQNNYKQENERLKKQIIKLEIANQQIKKFAKRTEAENSRLRELLRQYQNFNKRLVGQKQFQQVGHMNRNHSQKVLSERQLCHSKSNTSCFQNCRKKDEDIPFEYYNFSTSGEEEKQNQITSRRPISRRFEQKNKGGVETPIENARSLVSYPAKDKKAEFQNYDFQPKILFDPQATRSKYRPSDKSDKDRSIKISTFEQCRHIQSANDYILSSPFISKTGPSTRLGDKHSRTFRELKEAKLRISKRTEY